MIWTMACANETTSTTSSPTAVLPPSIKRLRSSGKSGRSGKRLAPTPTPPPPKLVPARPTRSARPTHALLDHGVEDNDEYSESDSDLSDSAGGRGVSESDSDLSDPAGGRGVDRVPDFPRRSCANRSVPSIGRVAAGEDLPNWTVERADCLDGSQFLLYRNPRGIPVGSRMAALASSGQLELPKNAVDELRDLVRTRRRHERNLFNAFTVAPVLRSVLSPPSLTQDQFAPRARIDYPALLDRVLCVSSGSGVADGIDSPGEARSLGERLVVVDFFCGIGGLALGLKAAGLTSILGVDKNITAARTFDANKCGWAAIRQQLRKSDLPLWERAFVDAGLTASPDRQAEVVLVGGPPCQPFSDNGNRRGEGDERDGFGFMVDITLRVRPIALVVENVPSLFEGGRFDDYVQPLVKRLCEAGYTARVTVHSCARHRVPQQRRRLLLTAIRTDAWPAGVPPPEMKVVAPPSAPSVSPFDALHGEGLWEGVCPVELAISPQTLRSRTRIRDASASTGVVVAGRPAPTILTTCVSNNCYQRLVLLPIDVPCEQMRNRDVRTLTVDHAKLLQSFPIGFQLFGHARMQGLLVGNAVPPMFAVDIGRALIEVLRTCPTFSTRGGAPERPHAHAQACIEKLHTAVLEHVAP